MWNTPQQRQVHCEQLTCELAKSDSPNRAIYFQVLFTFGLSVNETKGFDREHCLHIHSGMCQAVEVCLCEGFGKVK